MGFFDSIGTVNDSQAATSPVASSPAPTSSFFGSIGKVNTPNTSDPVVAQAVANTQPTAPTKLFSTVDKTGSYGFSDQKDASGKNLFAYRNPGDTATTTDMTRVATQFDPRMPSVQTPDTFHTPRAVADRANLKTSMGGSYSDQLDHKIALELSGSNDKSNLQIEPLAKGSKTATDPLENSLAKEVATGKKSLFDAQTELAKAKGAPTPWVGKQDSFLTKALGVAKTVGASEMDLAKKTWGVFGKAYDAAGGLLLPTATHDELRDPSLLANTAKGLPHAVGEVAGDIVNHPVKSAQALVGGVARGISDFTTNAIINYLPEDQGTRDALHGEVQKTLDKYLSPPETKITEGSKIAGSSAPILALGAAGKTLGVLTKIKGAATAGEVAGFVVGGQSQLDRSATIDRRTSQAMSDLVALGAFHVGSVGYKKASVLVNDAIAKSLDAYDKTPNKQGGFANINAFTGKEEGLNDEIRAVAKEHGAEAAIQGLIDERGKSPQEARTLVAQATMPTPEQATTHANEVAASITEKPATEVQKDVTVNHSDLNFNPNDLAQAKEDHAAGVKSMTKGNIITEYRPETGKHDVIDGAHRVQESIARGETSIKADVTVPRGSTLPEEKAMESQKPPPALKPSDIAKTKGAEEVPPKKKKPHSLAEEAKKYKTAEEFVASHGVQRIEEAGVSNSFDKPQGLYTTPLNVESPHEYLGGNTTKFGIDPSAKEVTVDTSGFSVNPTKRGVDQMATNLVWLRKALPEIADNIRGKSMNELKDIFSKEFPKTEWGRYTEIQDMIEGYAGMKARSEGIDVIRGISKDDPRFNEVVILNKDKVLTKSQLTDIYNQAHEKSSTPEKPNNSKPIDKLIASGDVRVVRRGTKDVYQYKTGDTWQNARNEDTAAAHFEPKEPAPKAPKADNLPDNIQQEKIGLEIAKQALEEHPLREVVKYADKKGSYKGEFPEERNVFKTMDINGVPTKIKVNSLDQLAADNGYNNTEDFRGAFSDYQAERAKVAEWEKEIKENTQKYKDEAKGEPKSLVEDQRQATTPSAQRETPPHEPKTKSQESSVQKTESPNQNTTNKVTLPIKGESVEQRVGSAIQNSESLRNQIINKGQDAYTSGRGLSHADLTYIRDKYQSGTSVEEIAKNTSNPAKATAFISKLRDYYDYQLAADRAAGGSTPRVENYVPQQWDISRQEDLDRFNELAKQKGLQPYDGYSAQPRVFNSYAEGEAAGFKPKNVNILEDLKQNYERGSDVISKQALHEGLIEAAPNMVSMSGYGKTKEGKPFVNSNIPRLEGMSFHPTVSKMLKGYEPLNGPDFINEVKKAGASAAIERSGIGGMIDRTVAMTKEVPKTAKEAGIGGVVGSIWDHTSGPMKELLWNFSGFHSVNVTLSYLGASSLHPIEGAKGLVQSVGAAASERVCQVSPLFQR
jgi:hypothetical protein